MDTMAIGTRLVELCNEGKNAEAINELYSDDCSSVEAVDFSGEGRELNGKEAILGKTEWFFNANEIHGGKTEGPFPHDDKFIVYFEMDLTPKEGPMAGQRNVIKECGLYTTRDGKVVKEEFFYAGM